MSWLVIYVIYEFSQVLSESALKKHHHFATNPAKLFSASNISVMILTHSIFLKWVSNMHSFFDICYPIVLNHSPHSFVKWEEMIVSY